MSRNQFIIIANYLALINSCKLLIPTSVQNDCAGKCVDPLIDGWLTNVAPAAGILLCGWEVVSSEAPKFWVLGAPTGKPDSTLLGS